MEGSGRLGAISRCLEKKKREKEWWEVGHSFLSGRGEGGKGGDL